MTRPAATMPLYATEQEISAAVLGPGRLEEWKAIAQVLETEGLPPIDEIVGLRYRRAVEQYFDWRNRVATGGATSQPQEPIKWTPRRPASFGASAPAGHRNRTG